MRSESVREVQSGSAPPPKATVSVAAPQPRAVAPGDNQAALLALLKLEAEARDVRAERDLVFLIANETRKLTRARQIFVLRPSLTGGHEVIGVSSLPTVDRDAPLVALIERIVAKAAAEDTGLGKLIPLEVPADDPAASTYPFRSLLWVPLKHGVDQAVGGIVLAREDAWRDTDTVVARRLAQTYAHAWRALATPRRKLTVTALKSKRWHLVAAATAMAALLFVRVPLSALAPVEIVPRAPFVVSAPIDGVIDVVVVDANQVVKVGDVLVRLSDTTLRNRLEVAERDVQVSQARLKQANQLAFSDERGMHDLALARSELSLKLAERDYAKDLLSKTEIRAQRDGVAIFADKRELTGKPVSVGELILEVAAVDDIQARIQLPVADAITLSSGAKVKLFLDNDPLKPWHAQIERADYKARVSDNDVVSFKVVASLDKAQSDRPLPRLGIRGTAQVTGEKVALGLYLFRRPIAAARQWLGL